MGKLTGGGSNRNASPSSSEGNANVSQCTKVRTGRSQGSKALAEDRLTAVLALVHELKVAGADNERNGSTLLCPRKETWSIMTFS
jgi:hypothetical protein